LLCRVLGISRSSYYKWLQRAPGALEQENEQIKRDIIAIYNKYKGIYGYRRICIYIRINLGKKVNHKRVYRLMKLLNLKAIIRRKRPHYQRSTPRITKENKLNRCFNVTSPNTTWLTDVTEFRIRDGRKVYLSAIYDLGSKKIVSYE
ncbi:TPA: IS3 family transposase, partial [Staphylococcus delphini]|nr:IS3 family transposase [Staphylococcus delphini]